MLKKHILSYVEGAACSVLFAGIFHHSYPDNLQSLPSAALFQTAVTRTALLKQRI